MSRMELNMGVIAGFILLCILMVAVGWLGDKSGAIDALGLRPSPTPTTAAQSPKMPQRPRR